MDSELASIEKIKRQEQENDKKFREKRTLETMLASLKRNIHEAVSATSKLKEEFLEVTTRADVVNAELIKAQALRCALAAQLEASAKQLQQLKNESEEGISKVWEARNTFCNAVHKVSDQCDVWALFTKPNYIETTMKPTKLPTDNINIENHLKERLDTAKKRRQSLIYERDRLLSEPTCGEEFKRKCVTYQAGHRLASTKIEENENQPIKFSTSPAARRTVIPVMKKTNIDMPWYQPYSVVASVAVFLIYFCVLREENDMDLEFNKTLYERIHGLEKEQLLQSYRYNKEHGKSVVDIERRLQEIEAEESTAK